MFKKKKKKYVHVPTYTGFQSVMNLLEIDIASIKYITDKINMLLFLKEAIKADLQATYITKILYDMNGPVNEPDKGPPKTYFDENGIEINTTILPEKIRLPLDDKKVITFPWESERFLRNALNLSRRKFEFGEDNHQSTYYKHMDICLVEIGNHSICGGIVHKNGFIEAKVINEENMFEHISCVDGDWWINAHTKEKLKKVYDFRIGLIYEISKKIYQLERENENFLKSIFQDRFAYSKKAEIERESIFYMFVAQNEQNTSLFKCWNQILRELYVEMDISYLDSVNRRLLEEDLFSDFEERGGLWRKEKRNGKGVPMVSSVEKELKDILDISESTDKAIKLFLWGINGEIYRANNVETFWLCANKILCQTGRGFIRFDKTLFENIKKNYREDRWLSYGRYILDNMIVGDYEYFGLTME